MYFLVKWLCVAIVRCFFKEVAVIHKERIPLYGPVIFVGNHNNQFLDACMLVSIIPRQVRFLIAAKSLKRRVVGCLARLAKCIGVRRGEDESRKGSGTIRVLQQKQQQQQHEDREETKGWSRLPSAVITGSDAADEKRGAAAAAVREVEKATQSFASRWVCLCIRGDGTRFKAEVSPGSTLTTKKGAYHVNAVLNDCELLATADPQPLPPFPNPHRKDSWCYNPSAGGSGSISSMPSLGRRPSLLSYEEIENTKKSGEAVDEQQQQQQHDETSTAVEPCVDNVDTADPTHRGGIRNELVAAAADAADAAAAADIAADEATRVAAALAADAAAAAVEASAAADMAAEAEYAAAVAGAVLSAERKHSNDGVLSDEQGQRELQELEQQLLGETGLRRRFSHKASTEAAEDDAMGTATFAIAAARASHGFASGSIASAGAAAVAAAAAAASAAAQAASAAEAAAAVASAELGSETENGFGPSMEYKISPKIDQSKVYGAVTQSLVDGDTIGIFPEGGSHDRTTLLPLKAGVAIMALTAMQHGAEEVLVVPVGLTYHNPHKMQSRASVHIGDPVPVTREMALEYVADRRGATARILNQVERGLRSCIITAQDYQAMAQIRLCASLYPPERLRLAEARYFLLMQLISKIFWRAANDPLLIDLRRSLSQYAAALETRHLADRQVWLLKQSPSGATLCLAETLVAIVYCAAIGLPLLPLWAPLRIIANILADKQREKAVRESRVKLRGMDVVASYKIMVLLVLVPLFNLLYGAIFGLLFLKTWTELVLSMLVGVVVLPVLYYYSMRRAERLLPLAQQLRIVTMVVVGSVNVWRQTDKELITQRLLMQIKVRDVVHQLGPAVSLTFSQDIQRALPTVLLDVDTKRLLRLRRQFAPLQMKTAFCGSTEVI
uniref:Glycerol 3-phosphate acyltransferase 1 n=1 Tax=Eimeria falciformis TaxID=84963 RepID=A0A221S5Z6_9EIME|nr:glycerol 3-phosphate acyltransferase 1 [Eimeria falciformis]